MGFPTTAKDHILTLRSALSVLKISRLTSGDKRSMGSLMSVTLQKGKAHLATEWEKY